MVKKAAPWLRALFVITALLLSQVQMVVASDSPSASLNSAGSTVGTPDTAHHALFLPSTARCDEKVRINSFLLASMPYAGPPNPALPYYGATISQTDPDEGGAPYVEKKAGDVLNWLVVVENSTLENTLCTPVNTDEALSEIQVVLDFSSNLGGGLGTLSSTSDFSLSATTLAHDGDIAWAVVPFTVPNNVNGDSLVLKTTVATEAVNDQAGGTPPDDVVDFDDDYVTVVGPGFNIVSFVPSPTSAAPGELVNFTLVVQNTRPGINITGFSVASTNSTFVSACTADKWTLVADGTPLTSLLFGQQAQCAITGIPIPNPPLSSQFVLAGDVTGTNGTPAQDLTLPATSDPVTIKIPAVSISKAISKIMRGSEAIYPSAPPLKPAAPGDVVTYEIVVTNSGAIQLQNLWVVDSLTGPIFLPPSQTLDPGGTLTLTTTHIVQQNSPDPLVNKVTVTAQGTGYPGTVNAETSAAYDIQDSALEVVLTVENPVTSDPVFEVNPGDTVRYRLSLRNAGSTVINSLTYMTLSAPLRTVGTPLPALVPDSLAVPATPGPQLSFTWNYTIQDSDPDPLISTIRIRGTTQDGMLLYGQSQAALDILNPAIGLKAIVLDPTASTVLRGATVVYQITVTNKGSQPICNVKVQQVRRDPDTGLERVLIADVPFSWTGTPGQLAGGEALSSTTSYLVTSEDKDPLEMVFKVTATDTCPGGGNPLSDSTTRVLDISDAQVNAELVAGVGSDGVAAVGEPIVFTFVAENVGAVTLDTLTATYCIRYGTAATAVCDVPFDPDKQLTPTTIGSFEHTTGGFTYTMTAADAEANPFVAEVTMFGTDNKGNQVSIKAATTVSIATDKVLFELTGPSQAVIGDTIKFDFKITNNTGVDMTDVHVYNMLNKVAEPDVYEEVATFATISGSAGSNEATGSFNYIINPTQGITGDVLTMVARVKGTNTVGPVVATGTATVLLIPILTVTKTGDPTAVAGQPVHYNVEIMNNSTSQDVHITDYEDAVMTQYNVTVNDDTFVPWPADPVTSVSTKGILPQGTTVNGSFLIPKVDPVPDPLVNTITVKGTREYDGATVSASGEHAVNIACPIGIGFNVENLDVGKIQHAVLGEYLRWTITITNASSASIDNIVVNEVLNWNGDVPANKITWQGGTAGHLDAGASAGLEPFTKRITNEDYKVPPGAMKDAVIVTFSETGGVSSCVLAFSYPVFSPIALLKIPDPYMAFTGETVTYDIFVANLMETDDDAYQNYYVTVTDDLLEPKPLPLAYDMPTSSQETTSGMMGPGEIIEKKVTRDVQETDPEELVNTLTAEFPDPTDETVSLWTSTQALVFTGNPLKLTKVPSTARAVPGTRITYDYTITNASPYPVTDIKVVDDLIGDLAPGITGSLINLDPGMTFSTLVGVPYDIPLDAPNPLVNTVTATGNIHLPDPENPTREVSKSLKVSVPLEDSDIKITKTAKKNNGGVPGGPLDDLFPASGPDGMPEVKTGTEVFYCFTIENRNTGTKTFVDNIAIEDPLFPGALQTPFQQAVIDQLSHPVAEADRVYGQETVNFCYGPVAVSQAMGDPLTNKVTINGISSAKLAVYAESEFSIDIRGTDLLITKLPSQPLAYVGEELIYTITIWNENSSRNIIISEVTDTFEGGAPLPLDLSLFDWSQSGITNSPVGVLGPGGKATLNLPYTVKNTDPDPLKNVATVKGKLDESGGDPPLPEDQWRALEDSTSATVAITASQLLVRKTASPNVASPSADNCNTPGNPNCQTVHYTITITNVGSVDVQGIVAVDHHFDVSTGNYVDVVYDEVSPTELTKVTLAPSQSAFIYYDLPMPTKTQLSQHPELDPFINQVTVYGVILDKNGNPVPPRDPDPTYPDKSIKTWVTESVDILQPMLRISKSPLVQATAPGGTVTYNVVISNIGDQVTDHLVFSDITGAQTFNLDQVCPNVDPAVCPFTYGPEPTTNGIPNPKDGTPYDPVVGLASKETLYGTVAVTVPADWVENQFTNVVEIKGQTKTSQEAVQDRSSATIDIRSEGLNVEKSASVASAPVGTVVTYTVRITNIGTTPMTRLVIADLAIDSVPSHAVTVTSGFPDSPEAQIPGDDSATLDPGETYVYTYDHTLAATDADPYINRVTVAGYTATGSALNIAEAVVDVQGGTLGVEKYVCVGDSIPPDSPACTQVVNLSDATSHVVTYYLRIFNPGPLTVQNITVADTIGTVPPITWPMPNNGLSPNDGLEGGTDEVWVNYPYTVQPGDPDPLQNMVTVSGQAPNGAAVHASASASLSIVTSDLRLTKSAVTQAQIGQDVFYTLVVENLSTTADITNIQVIDPFSPSGANPIPTCDVSTLTPGQTHSCQFTHRVALSDAAPLVNTATASGTQNGVTVTDRASHTVEIVTPGLSVTKTATPKIAAVGDTVTFTYVITNTGNVGITDLVVKDSNHDSAAFVPGDWPASLGTSEIRTWQHQITAQDPDPYTNTVTVTGKINAQSIQAEATETVFIANGTLAATNVPNKTFALDGESVTFTYTVTNLDPGGAVTGLLLDDNLCGHDVLTAQLPSDTLASGASATVYCTVSAALPGPLSSTFSATGQGQTGAVFDTATAEVPVTSGGLVVTKTADRLSVLPGGTITYTINVTNIGTQSLNTFTVTDPLVVSLSPAPPSTLAAGQSFTMTGNYVVSAVTPPSSVSNTVTVSAVGATTGLTYTDTASASVAVLENPNAVLSLTKEVSAQRVRPGDSVTYTFTIHNISATGTVATGVTLSDPALAPSNPVNIPDLGPGNSYIITRTVQIPADWVATTYTNTATVSANSALQDTASATVQVELLDFTKAASPDPAALGQEVSYTFTVTSFSTGNIPNVSISDPVITTWDTALPSTIPPAGATATGHTVIPLDYVGATFPNTAQLLVGAEVVDTAQATVNIRTGIDVTITGITQSVGGTLLPVVQTGQPVVVTFVLHNTGAQVVTSPAYTASVNIAGSTPCTPTGAALPATLQPSGSVTLTCTFTPTIGLAEYKLPPPLPDPLTRIVTINASGTSDSGTVTGSVADTFQMVDLQLTGTLAITPVVPGATKPGDKVKFTITLTNAGASPLGCASSVTIEGCHLGLTLDDSLLPDPDPALVALITNLANVSGTVISAGGTATFITGEYTLPSITADQNPVIYTVVADAGYYATGFTADIANAYVVHGEASTQLTIQLPKIEVTITAIQNNIAVTNPVYGQPITYRVDIKNIGPVKVQNLQAHYSFSAATVSADRIVLVSQSMRPFRQASSGDFSLNYPRADHILQPGPSGQGESASGTMGTTETHTTAYVFTVRVTVDGVLLESDDNPSVTLTPNIAGIATVTPTTGVGAGTATLDPNATDPMITKTASVANAQAGSPVVWTITIRNGGTTALSNVTMQDNVPDTLTIGSATTSRGTSVTSGQVITVTTGAMNPNDTITVTVNTIISATATSPSAITNTACAARDGGAQKCAAATVNLGPGASSLPATGIHSSSSSLPGQLVGWLGFALFGALMVLMSAQVSRRRAWIAGLFFLVALVIVVGAVLALVSGGGDKNKEKSTQQAQVVTNTPSQPPVGTVAPGVTQTPAALETAAPVQPVKTTAPGALVMQFPPTPTPYIVPTPAGVRYLMIPKLGDQFKVPIPIVELPLINQQWDVSGLGNYVGWLQGTTWLDPSWGNTVLVAHVQLGFNNPGPFWGLGELQPGDEIIVTEGDTQSRFKVMSTEKVNPDDWTVTAPTNGPTLTLITCTEWDNNYGVFSQRMIVRAVPTGQS